MAETITDTQTKTFSKTGVTGMLVAAFGALDIIKEAVLPLLQNAEVKLDWMSLVAVMGGVLVALFRKYSDGKIPKIV